MPFMTHSALLPGLAGSASFNQQHYTRVSKFLNTMLNSKNSTVKFVATRAQGNTTGIMGRNFAYLKVYSLSDRAHPSARMNTGERVNQIHEIIRVRDGFDQQNILSQDELNEILNVLCTGD